jgi:hypothetical protein
MIARNRVLFSLCTRYSSPIYFYVINVPYEGNLDVHIRCGRIDALSWPGWRLGFWMHECGAAVRLIPEDRNYRTRHLRSQKGSLITFRQRPPTSLKRPFRCRLSIARTDPKRLTQRWRGVTYCRSSGVVMTPQMHPGGLATTRSQIISPFFKIFRQ